jgi:mRNA interferase MazF
MGVKRGDVVTAAPPGDFGKPRPALVIQAFSDLAPERVTLALITANLSRLPNLRVPVSPSAQNGLTKASEVAVDNIQTFSVRKVGRVIGELEQEAMAEVEEALRRHLGLL